MVPALGQLCQLPFTVDPAVLSGERQQVRLVIDGKIVIPGQLFDEIEPEPVRVALFAGGGVGDVGDLGRRDAVERVWRHRFWLREQRLASPFGELEIHVDFERGGDPAQFDEQELPEGAGDFFEDHSAQGHGWWAVTGLSVAQVVGGVKRIGERVTRLSTGNQPLDASRMVLDPSHREVTGSSFNFSVQYTSSSVHPLKTTQRSSSMLIELSCYLSES